MYFLFECSKFLSLTPILIFFTVKIRISSLNPCCELDSGSYYIYKIYLNIFIWSEAYSPFTDWLTFVAVFFKIGGNCIHPPEMLNLPYTILKLLGYL